MKLSSRTIYGTGAMIEMALAYGSGPLSTQEIARRRSAPNKYMEQVLVDLRKAGLVTSARGAHGGYSLARSPDAITMASIYRATEGGSTLVPDLQRERALRQLEARVASEFWRGAHQAWLAELERTTLAQLAERQRRARPAAGMYYI